MPRKSDELTWEATPRRWRKIYKGKTYTISCRALGVPESKLASYRDANAWWVAKKAEVDGERAAQSTAFFKYTAVAPSPPIEPAAVRAFLGRVGEGDSPALAVRTVGEAIEAYLASQRKGAAAGQRSAAEVRNREYALAIFRDHVGAGTPVAAIDADTWERFHDSLLDQIAGGRWSANYAAKTWRYARWFLQDQVGLKRLEPPGNLRGLKIEAPPGAIATFTVAEVLMLYRRATGQMRLHILLALNCGFTAQDIADLHPDEVDPGAGTLTRKRGKTSAHANVPTVTYPLWGETRTLLQQYRSSDPDRVLVTKSGGPWVDRDGKNSDHVRANWRHLMRFTGIKKPFKLLRKTSATILESDREHGRFTSLFLGHAPRSIKDIHYARVAQPLFDAAIAWLHGRFFPEADASGGGGP